MRRSPRAERARRRRGQRPRATEIAANAAKSPLTFPRCRVGGPSSTPEDSSARTSTTIWRSRPSQGAAVHRAIPGRRQPEITARAAVRTATPGRPQASRRSAARRAGCARRGADGPAGSASGGGEPPRPGRRAGAPGSSGASAPDSNTLPGARAPTGSPAHGPSRGPPGTSNADGDIPVPAEEPVPPTPESGMPGGRPRRRRRRSSRSRAARPAPGLRDRARRARSVPAARTVPCSRWS